MTFNEQLITIVVVAAATMLTRFLPFILFPEGRRPPLFIQYLSGVLPVASISLLVVYCLKDVHFEESGMASIVAIVLIVVVHKWKKNMLLSILSGTLFYMVLV